jgi:hypothetical protein
MDVLTFFEGDLRDVAFYAARERNRIKGGDRAKASKDYGYVPRLRFRGRYR